MNRPEANFYDAFKRNHPTWFWQRIEDSISSGMPDVLCVPAMEQPVFIELKALPWTNVQLRKSQVAWITEFASKGGLVWVFNRDPKTKIIHGYRAPFPIVKGRKDHGKIEAEPTMVVTKLSQLKPHHLTKMTRRLV